jgi:hypothetical protein
LLAWSDETGFWSDETWCRVTLRHGASAMFYSTGPVAAPMITLIGAGIQVGTDDILCPSLVLAPVL